MPSVHSSSNVDVENSVVQKRIISCRSPGSTRTRAAASTASRAAFLLPSCRRTSTTLRRCLPRRHPRPRRRRRPRPPCDAASATLSENFVPPGRPSFARSRVPLRRRRRALSLQVFHAEAASRALCRRLVRPYSTSSLASSPAAIRRNSPQAQVRVFVSAPVFFKSARWY